MEKQLDNFLINPKNTADEPKFLDFRYSRGYFGLQSGISHITSNVMKNNAQRVVNLKAYCERLTWTSTEFQLLNCFD
ncbi:hypothetical protein KIN20_003367 [Parelaphostrongylus tenuis]|uniref:Uncharacterized protein n=1 Tax=Parelaphostrongylus tenuis TaxID=148309 RepID=A0AAD5LX72_PARTN|nr:hypothetical protein KIN20_003367 [Parelaphostrongylus tenuis]